MRIVVTGVLMGVLAQSAWAQSPSRSAFERPQEPARGTQQAPSVPPGTLPSDLETSPRTRYTSPDLLEAPVDPATYVLGPGDILAIMLLMGETRNEQLPVLPEGVVLIPNVGTVQASGRTLAEFRAALRETVAKRYRDFELYCNLLRQRQFRVYATGEVRSPGLIAARPTERVSDVIERAGGLTDLASRREIELHDAGGKKIADVDLGRFLTLGDLAKNPSVAAGQVVFVPQRAHVASVHGAVRAPGPIEVRSGETVRDLVDLAGGPLPTADLQHVGVERTSPAGDVRVETVNLEAEAPPADGVTGITVLSLQLGRPRVFFIAPDDKQTTIYIGEGETLGSLVRRTGDLPPDANLAGAQLATRDADGKPVQVPVDLKKVMAGEQDRPLKDGDALSVPSVKGYVYVSGYVTRPGRYVYRAEWTVNDYLGEAGGPALTGSRDNVTLLASDGSKRSGDRHTPVRRGETVYLNRSLSSRGGTLLGALVNVSALIISIVALTK